MNEKKSIFVIIGSASRHSANEKIIDHIAPITKPFFNLSVFKDLKTLPHFDPELSANQPPDEIVKFRNNIATADGVIICTPEYVFSIPSGLKNAIEWCVSTTVFSDKPLGIITASAHGQKGHEELRLIMKTVMAKFTPQHTLLIQGVTGKFDEDGRLRDEKTKQDLERFVDAFKTLTFPGTSSGQAL